MSIKSIYYKFRYLYATSSSQRYCDYLRKLGVKIGKGTKVRLPKTVEIDYSRPELLEIGEHVFIHSGTVIMTHDWASWSFIESHQEFYPSHGKVKIGNNVWLGEHVRICKGVTIGDNSIIGIGSVVTKSIPANSVAAGVPARVICSYDEYLAKRSSQYVEEAIEYAISIIESGREPVVEDFSDDYPCFVDGENYQQYNYPYYRVFKHEQFESWKKNHKKTFDGFEGFMNEVHSRMNK